MRFLKKLINIRKKKLNLPILEEIEEEKREEARENLNLPILEEEKREEVGEKLNLPILGKVGENLNLPILEKEEDIKEEVGEKLNPPILEEIDEEKKDGGEKINNSNLGASNEEKKAEKKLDLLTLEGEKRKEKRKISGDKGIQMSSQESQLDTKNNKGDEEITLSDSQEKQKVLNVLKGTKCSAQNKKEDECKQTENSSDSNIWVVPSIDKIRSVNFFALIKN